MGRQEMNPLKYLLLSFMSCNVYAANDVVEFHCPNKVITSQKLASPATNWDENQVERENNYARAALSTAPKNESMQLRADQEIEKNGQFIEKYDVKFLRDQGEQIHVVCEYFQTTATLSNPVPSDINQCEIRYTKKAGLKVEQGIFCSK